MKYLSTCHGKPIVRTKLWNRTVCSICGKYEAIVKTRLIQKEEKIIHEIGFPEDKKKFITLILPDTRDSIRHWQVTGKYSACGIRGFRTTDKKRVNCKNCMKKIDNITK